MYKYNMHRISCLPDSVPMAGRICINSIQTFLWLWLVSVTWVRSGSQSVGQMVSVGRASGCEVAGREVREVGKGGREKGGKR